MMTVDAAPDTISIMGPAEATQEQMISFIKKHNAKPKLTCSVEDIVNYYYQEAGREGIRPDVALCQAIKETGFFGYGGDVSPTQNNFCGLGATGNHEPGHSFATAQLGVRAHIQHLLAYTRVEKPSITIVAPDASDAALDAGNRKVKSAPDEASSYIYRGIVWYNRGDYTAALKDFSQALVFAPQSSEAHYDHAITATRLGNKKLARKDYDTLLEIAPTLNQGWFNRGLMRFEAKDYDGAIADMEQLLQIEDRSADARNLIGVAHIQQKKYNEAWKDFGQAAAINSANMNVLANQFIMEACLKK